LTATAKANLDKLVPVFNEYADTNIEIFGYTDSTGKPEYNLTLSAQRAASVKAYLVGKGLVSTRFKTSGLGVNNPIATNDTQEGRSLNRRVEFAITANDKMVQDTKKEAVK
jgi:outer membrane protein OmpA-like peptidoglycan-associated protein